MNHSFIVSLSLLNIETDIMARIILNKEKFRTRSKLYVIRWNIKLVWNYVVVYYPH